MKTLDRLIAEAAALRGLIILGFVRATGRKSETTVKAEGMTDNERHAAETVLRSAQLVMVGNWIEQELTGRLAQLKGELVSEVKQDKPTKDNTERLFTNAEKRIRNALRDVKLDLQTHLRKVGLAIGERHQEAMEAHHDLAGKAPKVTPSETPVGGLTLDEHFQKMGDDLITRFKAQMRIGLEADETTAELVRRIEGFGDVKASEPDMVHAASPLTALASILKAAEKSLSTLIQAAIKATANAIENGFFNDLDEDEVEEMGFVWVCAMERTCDLCLAYDGSKWDSDMNPIDGAPPYPGDPPDSMHPNCFIGETLILPIGRVAAVTKRAFNGNVVRITTRKHNFTCTPNHPILTDTGWKPAGSLNGGSRVVCYSDWSKTVPCSEWEHQNGVSRFKDVFESLSLSGKLTRREVPVSAPDFHGDGAEGKVSIIDTDGLLGNERDAAFLHALSKLCLPVGNSVGTSSVVGFVIQSPALAFINALLSAPYRIMGRSSILRTLLRRKPFHANSHLGTGGPLNDSIATKKQCNGSARSREAFGDSEYGQTGFVELDDVINVEVVPFHGDVFNMETSSNIYCAQGIIAHNCQCSVPECNLNEEVRVKGKKLDPYLQEADPKVLEASFGKANTRAFLEGDLNGNELLKTDHVLSPEAFARLKPAWKEFEEASK